MSDRQGILQASLQTAANVNEGTVLLDVIDAIPELAQPDGPPHHRPDKVHADKAYESRDRRAALEQRGITPRIARKGIESKTKLGRHRQVIERDFPGCIGIDAFSSVMSDTMPCTPPSCISAPRSSVGSLPPTSSVRRS